MPASYQLTVRPSPADHPLRRGARLVRGTPHPLPPEASWLSGWVPGILDQGHLGSCTGHGGAVWREVLHGSATRHKVPARLSRAYLWGKTRQVEGTFPADAGCTVADVMAVLHAWGICREELLPYREDAAEAPTRACDADAASWRVGQPMEVQCSPQAIKTVLAAGMPLLIGTPVGRSFIEVGGDGKAPLPPASETPVGGHCLCVVGYNAYAMMVANSWGTAWGDNGWVYLPWGWEAHWWEAWTSPLVS